MAATAAATVAPAAEAMVATATVAVQATAVAAVEGKCQQHLQRRSRRFKLLQTAFATSQIDLG